VNLSSARAGASHRDFTAHAAEELAAFHEIAKGLIDRLDVQGVLETILARATALAGTSDGFLYLAEGDELVVRLGFGKFRDEVGYRLARGEGLAGRVFETGEPLAVDDYQAWEGRRRDFDDHPFHAMVGVPLRASGRVAGVIGISHPELGKSYTASEVEVLRRFADLASLALENARLFTAADEGQTRFRSLVGNIPGAIYQATFDGAWSIRFMSDTMEELCGYPPEDFTTGRRTVESLIHPDDHAAVMAEFDVALRSLEPYILEYRVIHRDGSIRHVHERSRGIAGPGSTILLDGSLFDVTERRRAEETRTHLAAIVESSHDAIYGTGPDRTITSWNASAARIYGYTAEEVLGRPVSMLVADAADPEARRISDQVFGTGESVVIETVRRRKDGSLFDASLTVAPVKDGAGNVVGTSAVLRDVTERKRIEAERDRLLATEQETRAAAESARSELAKQNERLRELDHLKDEFIALISHELRTPLTSIRGYIDLILEDGSLTADQRRFLEIADRNSDRLLRLVGDLLLVAQLEAGNLELEPAPINLAAIAGDSLVAALPGAEAKQIDLILEAENVQVLGDSVRLGQVLDNLVSNAIKFTQEGGRVVVQVEARGGEAILEIRDSGIGIAPSDQPFLFDRFFRTAEATQSAIQGTGLGLTITKALVEAHGGSISVSSEEGSGTTFRVALQLERDAAPARDLAGAAS